MSKAVYLGIHCDDGSCVRFIATDEGRQLVDLTVLAGRTFQVHFNSDRMMHLAPVELVKPDTRCPVIVNGERCGLKSGHDGKHMWAGGD